MTTNLRRALAVCILALTGCNSSAPIQPTPVPELPMPATQTYRVQRGLVLRQIEFAARAQPATSQTLSFGTDGRVRAVYVKGGDEVKKGDVLAELDVTDIRAQLQQTQIQLQTAQSVFSETQKAYTRTVQLAQLDLDQARLRVEMARARASANTVGTLKNDLARNAQKVEDIRRSIADARSRGNQAGADNAEKVLRDALIEREKIEVSYNAALADSRAKQLEIEQLENEYKRMQLNLETRVEKIDPQQLQAIETAKIQLGTLEEKLKRGSIVAPFNGVIALQPLSVGDSVRALESTVIIAQPGELELAAQLSDTQFTQISIGQQVSCALASQPNRQIVGAITRVPSLGETRDRLVRIVLAEKVELQTGLLARCGTTLAKAENALWLPPNGVRRFRGRDYVVLQEGESKQRRVDVKIGVEGNDRIEILDGVKEGDLVVAP